MPEPNSSLSARDIRTVLFPPYDTSLARGLALFTHPPPSAEQRGTGVASGDLHRFLAKSHTRGGCGGG